MSEESALAPATPPRGPSGRPSDVGSHDWFMPNFLRYECCWKCGIVRRSDDKNKPCKGVVRVELRDEPSTPRGEAFSAMWHAVVGSADPVVVKARKKLSIHELRQMLNAILEQEGVEAGPPSAQREPNPLSDRLAQVEEALREIDTWSLVIESAVRNADPLNHAKVLAVLRSARSALKDTP